MAALDDANGALLVARFFPFEGSTVITDPVMIEFNRRKSIG
jgi:hypothetical protein